MNSISIGKELHYIYSEEDFANLVGEKMSEDARNYVMNMTNRLHEQQSEIEHLSDSWEDFDALENRIENLELELDEKDEKITMLEHELYNLKNRRLKGRRK